MTTPGCTTASRSTASISTIAVHPLGATATTQPSTAFAPPDSPVPAPRGTTGTPVPRADRDRRGDLGGLQRADDGAGAAVLGPLGLVVQVGADDVGVGQDAVGGERVTQLRQNLVPGCCHGSTVTRFGRQEASPVPV